MNNVKHVFNAKVNKNGRKEPKKHKINVKNDLQVNPNGKDRKGQMRPVRTVRSVINVKPNENANFEGEKTKI